MQRERYVIITPAFNEEKYIRATISGVLKQTVRPLRWVIVDDGSQDNTKAIAEEYESQYDFIECHSRVREVKETYFSSNVYAIQYGYDLVKTMDFDYLAILDADMVLCANYFEVIFRKFQVNPELGIASGVYEEIIAGKRIKVQIDRRSTPKALQVFNRSCYEQIGGYIPFRHGGEDAGAEVMARMYNWKTWSFPEIVAFHQKPVGTGDGRSLIRGRYSLGFREYSLGTHPVFMMAKCLRRCFVEYPYFLSGLARFYGFICGYFSGEQRQLPMNAVKYLRQEQWSRLLKCVGFGPSRWSPIESLPEEHKVSR
jgi:biofilm PGA synthesis N-glycosyltransferase PgaC